MVTVLVMSGAALTAQDGIKRTDLQTADLSIPGREVIQQMTELAPGVVIAKHTHPGEEVTVVLEGTLLLDVAGKPARTLKSGQAFTVPAGAVHGVKSTGTVPAKLLVTYIVEKGKPLRTAAP
jgi:quercetin dioxygenase-like cupin family protein